MEKYKQLGELLVAAGRGLSAGLCKVTDEKAERICEALADLVSEVAGDLEGSKNGAPNPARLLEAFEIQERELHELRAKLAEYEGRKAQVVTFKPVKK